MAVTENPQSTPDNSELETAKSYSSLETERPLKPEMFSANAEDIFATIRQAVESGQPRSEGYRRATEIYINQEDNPSLKTQAILLLGAPRAFAVKERINQVSEKLSQQPTPELKAEREALVDQILPYNHLFRDFIYENPGMFSSNDLVNWLMKAGGSAGEAKVLVGGFAAEVAVARLLKELPQVRVVRLSEIDEDRRGIDMVVSTNSGREVPIDVKTGGNVGFEPDDPRASKPEIGVHSHEIADFEISASYRHQVAERARPLFN